MRLKIRMEPYLYILPTALIIILIIGYPIARSVMISFYDFNFLRTDNPFVGLRNYADLFFRDQAFWRVMWNTASFTITGIAITYVLSLITALLLNADLRGNSVFQPLVLVPWVVPPVIAGVVWMSFYHPDFGLFNFVLKGVGLINKNQVWLGDKDLALGSVVAVTIWKYSPFFVISLLAGLKGIPGEVYESSALDGANAFQRFRYVTFPLLLPVTRVALVLGVIWRATHFDLIWMLTAGGPGYSSHLVSTYSYMHTISRMQAGMGAAIACVLVVVLLGFIAYFSKVTIRDRTGR